MRALAFLLAYRFPPFANSAPARFDIGDTHVIVIHPVGSWDLHKMTADYSLASFRSRNFGYQYVDASGGKTAPSSAGLLRGKISTPLSDAVDKIMAANGFGHNGSHVYFVSGPVNLAPDQMPEFKRVQNQLYRAYVIQQGDPASLGARLAAKKNVNVRATAAIASFGMRKLSADAVDLSHYCTLYSDISRLRGGANAALLPIPLLDLDFAGFAEVEVRRVTDNAGHLGAICIAYRGIKTAASEENALAMAIVIAGGVGSTPQEVQLARVRDYEERLAIRQSGWQQRLVPNNDFRARKQKLS